MSSSFPPSWVEFILRFVNYSPTSKGVKSATLKEELTPYSPGRSIL